MSFTPLRSHSATTPGFANPNRSTTFTFRLDGLDDENAPPDPTMGADAIIPGGGLFAISRQTSLAPSASTLATPRATTPVITPATFSPLPLRSSLAQVSITIPARVSAGKIRFRVDPTMLSTFDPKDKELYELWAGRLP